MQANQLLFATLLLGAAAVQAQGQGMSMPMKAAPAASAPASLPVVDAHVRKIDSGKGMVVLQHGDIPNLGMIAMTMGFDVADKKQLKGLKVGDKVKFQADMVGGRPTVTSRKKARWVHQGRIRASTRSRLAAAPPGHWPTARAPQNPRRSRRPRGWSLPL
ncbi:MAG: hypothetical protein NVS2B4_04480 [Ramlibacter sp.]